MAFQRKPITPCGFKTLKKALKHLREVSKPENIAAIEEALAHGDLSENAEFKFAKEQQGFIAGRETELETAIASAEIIDPGTLSGERVVFGATVTLLDVDADNEVTYTIVGETESDVNKGRISISSPIARGLIGNRIDDSVVIKTPKGNRELEILEVQFVACEDWD